VRSGLGRADRPVCVCFYTGQAHACCALAPAGIRVVAVLWAGSPDVPAPCPSVCLQYEAVRRDLNDWWPKLRPGGMMAGEQQRPQLQGTVGPGDTAVCCRRAPLPRQPLPSRPSLTAAGDTAGSDARARKTSTACLPDPFSPLPSPPVAAPFFAPAHLPCSPVLTPVSPLLTGRP
jgi:hypothetical protein